jgi:DNA-binding LytR/AlgR family response regulator
MQKTKKARINLLEIYREVNSIIMTGKIVVEEIVLRCYNERKIEKTELKTGSAMQMIKIAICDDNREDMNELSAHLKEIAKMEKIAITIEKYDSSEKLFFNWEDTIDFADILFMETHIKGINGLAIADKLRHIGYDGEVIFNTRSEPEVFEAFDVDAFHYILKGVTAEKKFKRIFLSAVELADQRAREYITLATIGESRSLAIKDIKYFEVKGRIITAYYGDGKSFEFYTPLEKLFLALSSKGFIRTNRNTIVNIAQVDSYSNSTVTLKDDTVLKLGRAYKKEVTEDVGRYFGEVLEIEK